jgi:hypothetical protein
MGLMERDYMKETYEDRKKARIERIEKEERKSELWHLYGKEHKTIFDKMRIKELEQINLYGVGRQIDGNANSELFFRHLSY